MNYKIMSKKNPLKPADPEKFYPYPKWSSEMNLRRIAEQIARHCTLPPADVTAVLEAFLSELPCRCNGCTGSVSFRITRLSDERSFRASGRFRIDEAFFQRRRSGNGGRCDGKGNQEPAGSLLSRCRIQAEASKNGL